MSELGFKLYFWLLTDFQYTMFFLFVCFAVITPLYGYQVKILNLPPVDVALLSKNR